MDFIDHRSAANFKFGLSATDEKLRITSDGDVGIGVTNPSTKLEVDGVITTAGLTTTANVSFGDNDKAIFGAGSDLQIYHDGFNSYIEESGAGSLLIRGDNTYLTNTAGTKAYIDCVADGEVILRHNNAQKLATTSTGIDVTGTSLADTLETSAASGGLINVIRDDPTIGTNNSLGAIYWKSTEDSGTTVNIGAGILALADQNHSTTASGSRLTLQTTAVSATTPTERLRISSGGDISFYEDTGTTAKLFWDSSAESLGIGTTTPFDSSIHATGKIRAGGGTSGGFLFGSTDFDTGMITPADGNLAFTVDNVERIRISSGNVGVGTDSPISGYNNTSALDVSGPVVSRGAISAHQTNAGVFQYNSNETTIRSYGATSGSGQIAFSTGGGGGADTERTRIDSSGNLLVGKTSSDLTTDGFEVRPTGFVGVRSNGDPLYLNRKSSDGAIATFAKDGTTVGSIGTVSGLLGIGSGDAILAFDGSGNAMYPMSSQTGGASDGVLDFGSSLRRFKDLYLSGTANVGGLTVSAPSGDTPVSIVTTTAGSFLSISDGNTTSGRSPLVGAITDAMVFYTSAGSYSERMRIDASGNVGIGTSSPFFTTAGRSSLSVNGSTSSILAFGKGGSSENYILADAGGLTIANTSTTLPTVFFNNGAERMRIDSSGSVGVGGSEANPQSFATAFGIHGSTNSGLYLHDDNAGRYGYLEYDGNNFNISAQHSAGVLNLKTNDQTRVSIDASGHLLVGTTDSDPSNNSANSSADNGIASLSSGEFVSAAYKASANTGSVGYFNRTGTDGAVLEFRKSGTTVGSIGTSGGNIYAGKGGSGLIFNDAGTKDLIPYSLTASDTVDNSISLGISSKRFKTLYLSGTANVGGLTVNAPSGDTPASIVTATAGSFLSISDGNTTSGRSPLVGAITDNLVFYTSAGSYNEAMRIDSSGNLLVGTTSLADVNNIVTNHLFEGANSTAGAGAVGVYNNTGTAYSPALVVLNRDASTDTTNRFIQFYADVSSSSSTAMGGIVGNGASNVQFAALSDAREKTNIESISGSLDKINTLNPVEFDWIASGEHVNAGFVAQEVEQVFPEFVVENMADEGAEERKGLTGGMTGGIVAHLVKAIQEQNELINDLRARVAQLEGAN